MAEGSEDWISDSNEAIRISLVKSNPDGPPTALHSFNPKMTYSIFGEEEQVFGYKGLKINLRFNAHDMRPQLQVLYTKKFKAVGETEPTDVKEILEEYLPKTAFENSKTFEATISDPKNATWSPPGELWQSLESGGETYEVWKGNLSDLAVQQMIKRVGIMIPLFIEGGTLINLDEPDWSLERWTVFFLFHKNPKVVSPASPYTFMGYCTVYRYFFYQPQPLITDPIEKKNREDYLKDLDFQLASLPEIDFATVPCRSRISQFIILPPFQSGGNGSRFYNSIFDFYLQDPATKEITVEDPNEAFDDLRDLNDLARLRKNESFDGLKINTASSLRQKDPQPREIVETAAIEKLRKSMKIAPRQFLRVTELNLLSRIPLGVRASLIGTKPTATGEQLHAQEHEYHLWQLWVKERLYRHNKDMLIQLERTERIDKLEQALGGVEGDYARLLRNFEGRWKKKEEGKGLLGEQLVGNGNGLKRASAAPESDDDEAEEEENPRAKKIRFS